MSTINETYYGIRVGDPRRHKCYLWVGEDGTLPVLFNNREDAEEACCNGFQQTPHKVVRVKVRCG